MGRSCDGGGEKVRPETQLPSQKQQQRVSCAPARAGLCVKHYVQPSWQPRRGPAILPTLQMKRRGGPRFAAYLEPCSVKGAGRLRPAQSIHAAP